MRLCYALRRGVYFPSDLDLFGTMPPREHRAEYLKIVKSLGFEAVEVPATGHEGQSELTARAFRDELANAGLVAGCVRGGGPVAHPTAGAETRARLTHAIRFASWIGASVVNVTFVTPATQPDGPGAERRGEQVSQGASRYANEADFESTANHVRRLGQMAADLGLDLAIEVHQGSIADNSYATNHLLDLIDLSNVGSNPDLGNILWQFETPEESAEAAIVALAGRAKYWHCKNLKRVHIPDLRRSFFLRVPLPDGDIDYRFAIAAMQAARYKGYLAVEGAQTGDQLTQDGQSAAYVRKLLGGQ